MSDILINQTNSPFETEQAGFELAGRLGRSGIVALYGELGSGKTCFVKGIARGLKIVQSIKSPSFSIINEYQGEIPLYHMDFYRLENPLEIDETGWEEYLNSDGIIIIEWAERIRNMLPGKRIDVYFEILDESARRLRIVIDDDSGN